jgi:hypothetical protein
MMLNWQAIGCITGLDVVPDRNLIAVQQHNRFGLMATMEFC